MAGTVERNALLLFADQHNADVMGCAGHPIVETPNLDQLAAKGVRFTRAYCQDAICVPSRTSLMTGLYPRSSGRTDFSRGSRSSHNNLKKNPGVAKKVENDGPTKQQVNDLVKRQPRSKGKCTDFYATLLKAGVDAELHVFSKGGHGFSLGDGREESTALWSTGFAAWLRDCGMIEG